MNTILSEIQKCGCVSGTRQFANRIGHDPRYVARVLAKLEGIGAIVRVKSAGGRGRRTTIYPTQSRIV